ncbi:MAG: hypothetical protein Q8N17_11745 [Burkholderiaceae bacterium]|nr:hypothetical protein [Burkholderiaceae bacterium]
MNSVALQLSLWLQWRLSAVGRAAAHFRRDRHDYYLYLSRVLSDAHGASTLLRIFQRDAQRFAGEPRGVLSRHWARRYQEQGADLALTWRGTLPPGDLLLIGAAAQAGGAGALEQALADAARLAGRAQASRRQFLLTVAAGLISLAIALAVIVAVPVYFLPLLHKAFSFVPLDMWGAKGRALMSFGRCVQDFWLPVLAALLLPAGLIAVCKDHWCGPGRQWLDRRLLPCRLYRDARAAEFLATLCALLRRRGNVTLTLRQGLTLIRQRSSPWLAFHCDSMLRALDEGGEAAGGQVLASGLLRREDVFYLTDMMEALGVDHGLQLAGTRIEAAIDSAVARSARTLRAAMLLGGCATVFALASWMALAIAELKSATALVFA